MESGVTCVVPARLGSTRFFGKLLRPLAGKPVVLHALERARDAECFERIVCLTDSEKIAEVVSAGGFEFVLTGEAANGTERIARALPSLPGDLFVNLQGDEPAFPPEGLRALRDALRDEPSAVHLLVHESAPSEEELRNPHRVKVLLDGDAVTGFTRAAPSVPRADVRLQLGAYAYARAYLERYAALPPSAAELDLAHEMLRDLALAPLRAHACPVDHAGASVDAPADLEAAERALEELFSQPQARLQGISP